MVRIAGAIVLLAVLTALLCLAYFVLRGQKALKTKQKDKDSQKKTIPSATSPAVLRG